MRTSRANVTTHDDFLQDFPRCPDIFTKVCHPLSVPPASVMPR